MSQYLVKVRDVDPNDSEAVKDALTAFFQNLSKLKSSHSDQWLRVLENVINRFPKYCGQHRATIENYLIPFLDSKSYYSVILAGKCAHSLQQVRPPQERTASAKSCWRELMTALCDAAHALVDALFTKSANHNTQKKISQADSLMLLALEDIQSVRDTQDVASKTVVLSIRLQNVLVFIQAMLVEIYPVAKPIRPQLILEVILRALSASGNEDSETVAAVKIQALRTLDALVACLGSNLIPFSSLVFRLVMQTIRWSSDNLSKESRKVRVAAYSSLSSWLARLRRHRPAAAGRAHTWDSGLTAAILRDVTPAKHVMLLTANAQPMKNLSKKARKRLANSMLMQSNISSHVPGEKNKINITEESNDEIIIAALECAEAFLTVCGIFLRQTIHKQLQEVLVNECSNIDSLSAERGIALLRALEACRKSSSCPPTQYCLLLYSQLVNCSQVEISKFCSQALLDIRLHLHCSPPSLNFAHPQPERTKQDERKRVSERNRSALMKLLGEERMPSELAKDEEIITIPDEPSTKRVRIDEDVSEKISLSSESSASSIEISDDSTRDNVQEIYFEDIQGDTNEPENVPINTNSISTVAQDTVDIDHGTPNTDKEIDTDEPNIHELKTQIVNKNEDIFEAVTQLPLRMSNDTVDGGKSPDSMEVAYDYPNTTQEKVAVLEKIDDENLPSTNDTDDIQITCGQQVKSSQDMDSSKTKELDTQTEEPPKENGIDKSPERIVQNGDVEINLPNKLAPNDGEVTVDDMLADFVDEVNEDSQT